MFKLRPHADYGHRQFQLPTDLSPRPGALHLRAGKVTTVTIEELDWLRRNDGLVKVELLPVPSVPARAARAIRAAEAAKLLAAERAAVNPEGAAPEAPAPKGRSKKKSDGGRKGAR